ncbi:hypothetical protein K439DRAFT_1644976 [Ramaria rubella]|nr:hypothetical protein K439DRAFT_1644976 [Ramaria rubella]
MDETGFQPSDQGTQRVIGRQGTKTQDKQGGGDQETVTALITICADGTTLCPTVIFKGKNFHEEVGEQQYGTLATQWIVNNFDAQMRAKANGHSHYTPKLLRHAKDNQIIILGYPPHCTHALQGLYVICFAHMKDIYRNEVHRFEELHSHKMAKADFMMVFGTAFLRAFTVDTVKAAFKATGIHPYNPGIHIFANEAQ